MANSKAQNSFLTRGGAGCLHIKWPGVNLGRVFFAKNQNAGKGLSKGFGFNVRAVDQGEEEQLRRCHGTIS